MNLNEFLNYQNICPFCKSLLSISCNNKRSIVNINNNIFIIKSKFNYDKYIYEIVINIIDNSIYINFYKEIVLYNSFVPLYIINSFKEYSKNRKKYYFIKHCKTCNNYAYCSNEFNFSLKNFLIKEENFITTINNKKIRFVSNYEEKNSTFYIDENKFIFNKSISLNKEKNIYNQIESLLIFL